MTYIVLMTFTGNKSSETILGSHACRFDKLEDFAITFWKTYLYEDLETRILPSNIFHCTNFSNEKTSFLIFIVVGMN